MPKLTYSGYQQAVIKADAERAAWAGWLALCQLAPTPRDTATPAGVMKWTQAVNRRAQEIFARVN